MSALAELLARAERLPFVVLVACVERLAQAPARVGGVGPFHAEPVRFRHEPSLAFHSADLSQAKLNERGDAAPYVELTTTFAGLTGAASPLPPMLLEGLARGDDEEALQRDLLDIFHHRLLGLFYQGLLKFDLPRSTQQPATARALDWALLLGGLAPSSAERVTALPLAHLLHLAPLLVAYPANAERLAVAVRSVFQDLLGEAEVCVCEMKGGSVAIETSARARLGVDLRLGRSSTLGARVPAPASEILIVISPLSPEACARLSPGGEQFAALNAVALLFTPETVQVTVELRPIHAYPARLGTPSARLGRNAWLGGRGRPVPVRFTAAATAARKDLHAS